MATLIGLCCNWSSCFSSQPSQLKRFHSATGTTEDALKENRMRSHVLLALPLVLNLHKLDMLVWWEEKKCVLGSNQARL